MIADIMTNKKFQSIIKELFIRCRKLKISLVFITQSFFSALKDVRVNSTHYLIIKINNKRELKNIAINHSADIDYQDFIKIYRECTKEPSASVPLRFRKYLFDSYKNDNKKKEEIMQNEAQYDLDRKAAKISALSSNNLDKYEYLTGE